MCPRESPLDFAVLTNDRSRGTSSRIKVSYQSTPLYLPLLYTLGTPPSCDMSPLGTLHTHTHSYYTRKDPSPAPPYSGYHRQQKEVPFWKLMVRRPMARMKDEQFDRTRFDPTWPYTNTHTHLLLSVLKGKRR